MKHKGRSSVARKQRQEQAKQRHEIYSSKTPEQLLNELDSKFGKGLGSKRERVRLRNKITEK